MIGSVLHGATPASIRGWLLKAGTVIMSRLISQIWKLKQSRLSRAIPSVIRGWLSKTEGVLLWGAFLAQAQYPRVRLVHDNSAIPPSQDGA